DSCVPPQRAGVGGGCFAGDAEGWHQGQVRQGRGLQEQVREPKVGTQEHADAVSVELEAGTMVAWLNPLTFGAVRPYFFVAVHDAASRAEDGAAVEHPNTGGSMCRTRYQVAT